MTTVTPDEPMSSHSSESSVTLANTVRPETNSKQRRVTTEMRGRRWRHEETDAVVTGRNTNQ